MNKAFLVNFQDGVIAIHEAENSTEIFNHFEEALSCTELETVKELIAEYEAVLVDCICSHCKNKLE